METDGDKKPDTLSPGNIDKSVHLETSTKNGDSLPDSSGVEANIDSVADCKQPEITSSEINSTEGCPVEGESEIKSEMEVDSEKEKMPDSEKCSKGMDSAQVAEDNISEQPKEEDDEYTYTKRDDFTSEIYKISVTNLPKRFGFAEFKKKIGNQLSLKPVKLKIWKEVCFLTFRCEEEREEALKKINGFMWRGQPLKAELARPAADPFMRKRKQEERESGSHAEKKPKAEDDGLSPVERLKNSVTPLWKLSYEDQLKKKEEEMRGFFKKWFRQIEKNCPDLRSWLASLKTKLGYHMPCELQSIKPSPQTEGYRNKCEFTIGPGLEGQGTSVVGFRYGLYSEGMVCVGSPEEIAFLPDNMKTVTQAFQKYVTTSGYNAFNPVSNEGHWRQLTIRTSRLGHVMALVDFHPQGLTEEELDIVIGKMKGHFLDGDGKESGMTSCYFRSDKDRPLSDSTYKLVFGDEHITESLLDMKFRISPNAFFQVNTVAAEVLYSQVADWCNHSPTTTVLDVCCGTGTIGLTVAKKVASVIGVEMCSEAIKDAEYNAQINGISNVKYHCGKAEDVMKHITKSVRGTDDVVAVVDPPRGGLHSNVVVALRNCKSIKRLVYVSCNANGALNNFIDLLRPTSKRLKGPRFYPVKAVPVDLFPHTIHCELVILFEREITDTVNDSD